MSYHNTSSSYSTPTTSQRQAAPPGYHYMPDGSLMLDSEMQSAAQSTVQSAPTQNATNNQGQTAPVGFHYMPDGSLMSDVKHAALYNQSLIKDFNINTGNISQAGEARDFIVLGDNGALFNLEVKNGATFYNFTTNKFQAAKSSLEKISITNGNYKATVVFPAVSAGAQYDVSLMAIDNTKHNTYKEVRFADGSMDINSTKGSNSRLIQKVIYQTLDVTATLSCFSPTGVVTGVSGSATVTASRGASTELLPFSFIFTATNARTLTTKKNPASNDVMAFVERALGDTPVAIPGENIYPTATAAFTGDDINGAVTSGAVVRMDNTDLSAVIKVGDKITTPTTTSTVDGAVSSGVNVSMDNNVTTIMAVGDQVTCPTLAFGGTNPNNTLVTVAALSVGGDTSVFALSEAIALDDGAALIFSSKINRSLTTVTVVETSSTATDFTMSQAIQFRDNCPLTFFNQRNYKWLIDNNYGLTEGMRLLADPTANGFTGVATIKNYVDEVITFEGQSQEKKYVKYKAKGLEYLGVKPVLTRNATTKVVTTTQAGTVTFNQQALLAAAGVTQKIFAYGETEINRLYGYNLQLSDLKVELQEVSTTTTASTIGAANTEVVITERNGIMDAISTVSGIGINPNLIDPTVASGAGSVSGAGTITLSAAQELENGAVLTFSGASRVVTISGNIKINHAGNEDVALRFDLDKFLTMH